MMTNANELAHWVRKRAATPSTDHPLDSRQFLAIADLIERQEAELDALRSELHDALHEAENVNQENERLTKDLAFSNERQQAHYNEAADGWSKFRQLESGTKSMSSTLRSDEFMTDQTTPSEQARMPWCVICGRQYGDDSADECCNYGHTPEAWRDTLNNLRDIDRTRYDLVMGQRAEIARLNELCNLLLTQASARQWHRVEVGMPTADGVYLLRDYTFTLGYCAFVEGGKIMGSDPSWLGVECWLGPLPAITETNK